MTRHAKIVLPLGLCLAGLTAAWWLSSGPQPEPEAAPVREVAVAKQDRDPGGRAPVRPRPAVAVVERAPAPSAKPDRAVMRDRIRQALRRRYADADVSERSSDPPTAADEETELPPGKLTKEYIRDTVRDELVPLVQECYGELLRQDDRSGGRVVMQFDIMGDESVGGIVDDVRLTDETEIEDADFGECVRESMASVVFEPPEGGGIVSVTYPLVFTPAESGDAQPG